MGVGSPISWVSYLLKKCDPTRPRLLRKCPVPQMSPVPRKCPVPRTSPVPLNQSRPTESVPSHEQSRPTNSPVPRSSPVPRISPVPSSVSHPSERIPSGSKADRCLSLLYPAGRLLPRTRTRLTRGPKGGRTCHLKLAWTPGDPSLPVRTAPPGVRLPAYIQLFAVVIYGTRPVFDFLINWDEISESRIAEKHHRADARRSPGLSSWRAACVS